LDGLEDSKMARDRSDLTRVLAIAAALAVFTACATGGAGQRGKLYAMPADLGQALSPEEADPRRAAELAEAALHQLDPEQPGGPDYEGAARTCLLATEVADPRVERPLERACYRVAARSALRSGNRELYIEVVRRWEEFEPRRMRQLGELALHRALRDRLQGRPAKPQRRIPPDIRRLLPPVENEA
jgi:hypothetical protein